MTRSLHISRSGLSADLETIVDRFERAWRAGSPPSLREYLHAEHLSGQARLDVLEELVKVDLEFRWRSSGQPSASYLLEHYVQEFPELLQQGNGALDLIAEEYRVRQRWGDRPTHQDYATRFPEHAAYLSDTLKRIDDELGVEASRTPSVASGQETVSLAQPAANFSTLTGQQTGSGDSPNPLPAIAGYEILEVLGRGGMGVVYKTRHLALKRLVAVKMIVAGGHAGREQITRFRAEAEAVARLQHANIVQIYEVGEQDGLPFFSLEYVDGGSLDKKLAGTPQTPRAAAQLDLTLAQAMHAAHQAGIVHRDLKPANVLVTRDGVPKITDFGLAKQLDSAIGQTQSGAILGTPSYMAPEQATGKIKEVGPATDVYALGAILYEMLTGRPPFKAATPMDTMYLVVHEEPVAPSRLQPKVPRDLETICLKCLQKEQRKRYPDARSLADDLQRYINGEPIQARPIGMLGRLARWARRQPVVAGLSAAMLVLFITGFALVTWKWRESIDRGEKLTTALGKEKQARIDLKQTAYFDKITAFNAEFLADNLGAAAALLDDCPKELRGWEWHYLNRLCRGAPLVCEAGGIALDAVALRPDGLIVASGGEARLWLHDARSGKLLREWRPEDGVRRLCWQTKGRWFASGGGKVLRLHDPDTGETQHTFPEHHAIITSVGACPQGRSLASGDLSGMIILWDSVEKKKLHTLAAKMQPNASLVFHPDGSLLASSSDDKTIKIWDVTTGTLVMTSPQQRQAITVLAWSPCGQWLVSGSHALDNRSGEAGAIKVWKAERMEEIRELPLAIGFFHQMIFRADGKQLAAACRTGARRWSWPDLQELPPIRLPGVSDVSYGSDGRRLATADGMGLLKLWDPDSGQEPVDARPSPRRSVFSMAVHPTKRLVAYGDGAGAVEVVDLNSRKLVEQWHRKPIEPVFALAWNPAGTMIAAGRQQCPLLLCRMGEPDEHVLEGHTGRVYGIAFTPDGKQLLSASTDSTVKVWDTATRKELDPLADPRGRLDALAVNAQGTLVAAPEHGGPNGRIRLWTMASREPCGELPAPVGGPQTCVAFDPDGARLAAGGPTVSSTVQIWDVAARKEIAQCRGHKQKITSVAWSPDGKRLVSSSDDGTVRVWEPISGRLLLTLRGHKGVTTAAAFTADGQLLVSTGWDGAVRVWNGTPLDESTP